MCDFHVRLRARKHLCHALFRTHGISRVRIAAVFLLRNVTGA